MFRSQCNRTHSRSPFSGSAFLLRFTGVVALVSVTGCGITVNDVRSDQGRIGGDGEISLASTAGGPPPVCDTLVTALVIPTGYSIQDIEVLVEGSPVPVNTKVDPNYQTLIEGRIDECGETGFDPATQELLFLSFAFPGPCSGTISFEFSFLVLNASMVPTDLNHLIIGGTLVSDLLNAISTGDPLALFGCIDEEVLIVTPGSPIPTASTWGLAVLAFLLLAGGKVLGRNYHVPAQQKT